MDENKSKRSDLDIANEFDRLFNEIPEPETDEEIREFLVESGYDPEALKAQGREFVHNLIATNWRFVSSNEIDEAVTKIDEVPTRKEWSRSQLTKAIQKLSAALTIGGKQPSLAFRNLEELTDSDLAVILQELEYKARASGVDFDLSQG
ncbi:MAG: hypothetical protein HRF47_09090 [Chloroflexota bacterium]|jgi:hypothetical protein|nr:hypothetical protein [Chloroflexota bacterium]MBI5704558.1 hypothetical protein [Chloroflexota bacterium]